MVIVEDVAGLLDGRLIRARSHHLQQRELGEVLWEAGGHRVRCVSNWEVASRYTIFSTGRCRPFSGSLTALTAIEMWLRALTALKPAHDRPLSHKSLHYRSGTCNLPYIALVWLSHTPIARGKGVW